MRARVAVVFLFCGLPCAMVEAQVQLQREPPPATTATNAPWYLAGAPMALFGDFFYPTGPTVYFNGNTMVPTAVYGGITIYADTTLEPYSIVFVPIGRSLMRPYERRRAGALAGTVGSTTPSFPIQLASEAGPGIKPLIWPSAALPVIPTASSSTESVAAAVGRESDVLPVISDRVFVPAPPSPNEGIWIQFEGTRWRAAGKAQDFSRAQFLVYGEYAGFPVYVDRDAANHPLPQIIFLPVAKGRVTPYGRIQP